MYTQEKTFKNPIEEQRKAALEHYEQASRAANHWSSFVESAIKAYSPESCPPPVSAEVVSADVFYKAISDRINHFSNIHHSYEAQELHDALNVIMRLVPPSQFLHLSPSSKADEMERLKNKLADDFRKNYTLDLNAEGAAEEGFKAGWDKLLVLLQNQPSAKAIAEAAFTAGQEHGIDIDKEQYLSQYK